jgi:hypothetical protein
MRVNQVSAAQRVQSALNRVNDPTSCPKCGSVVFFKVSTYQFAGQGSYNYRVISVSPLELLMCPCGHPMLPDNAAQGATRGSEREAFVESIRAAQKFRNNGSAPNLAELTSKMAPLADLESLRSEVDTLIRAMQNGGHIEVVEEETPEVANPEVERINTTRFPPAMLATAPQEGDPEVDEKEPEKPTPPATRNGRQAGLVQPKPRAREIIKGAQSMKRQGA